MLPLEQSRAVAILRDWLLGWLEGLRRPLPVAVETAFAYLLEQDESKQMDKARACYEGSAYALGERDKSVALQRSYPAFASLVADEEFAGWAEALYQPLLRGLDDGWLEFSVVGEQAQ